MTITVGDKDWRPAYLALAAYSVACILAVVFAPTHWDGFTPAARLRSTLSDFPSTTAFCIDAMWALFPFALAAFSATAPLKIRKTTGHPILALAFGFALFGLLITPLLIHYNLFHWSNVDLSGYNKNARLLRFASHSKTGLAVVELVYFSVTVCSVWISYVAIPRAFLQLRREA